MRPQSPGEIDDHISYHRADADLVEGRRDALREWGAPGECLLPEVSAHRAVTEHLDSCQLSVLALYSAAVTSISTRLSEGFQPSTMSHSNRAVLKGTVERSSVSTVPMVWLRCR